MVSVFGYLLVAVLAADAPIFSDQPYSVEFAPRVASFVRIVIHETAAGEPCIDELEVYGPTGEENLALASRGARAAASSCLPGYSIHRVDHLNDGLHGNDHSWIAATRGREWAQIELPRALEVARVVISRDRKREYADRVPVHFEIQLSDDGRDWVSVREVKTEAAPVAVRRRVRGGAAVVPPPPPFPAELGRKNASAPAGPSSPTGGGHQLPLREAFIAEEHAWLKTYGRADLSPRLVPYNGRVKEYPRHVGDDRLPLPPLAGAPVLDGRLDDSTWSGASRGVVRVAWPRDFQLGPLVSHAVSAGRHDGHLYLGLRLSALLSTHVAVLSVPGRGEACVIAHTATGLVLETYDQGALRESAPLEGRWDDALTCCEVRLPLSLFPDADTLGIRVGLGLGGKHTAAQGRGLHFLCSNLSIAEVARCRSGTFRVRLGASAEGESIKLRGNARGIEGGQSLRPGQSRTLSIGASGPIGPEFRLRIEEIGGEEFVLNLFRYDPLTRTLNLFEDMVRRFDAGGRDVSRERDRLLELRALQRRLSALVEPDLTAERTAFFEASVAKRELFFREPELEPLRDILFVRRHAFEPSHNYSVLLDSRWRPGGGIHCLRVPLRDGRLHPAEARVKTLFDAGDGIARTPMASFDAGQIYFAHRASREGFYHLMRVNADGSELEQLTDGPFHDYWPCPLPDGGLAFITTRCKARYLCWRPQAAVLFRLESDGRAMRPLSFANLSEWAPSVMNDGRIIWTRSEYIDKGADFSHTLWAVRPDGTRPDLIFGNTIIQPNGYANGREVPGTREICCTLISHFGDLNGPIALVDLDRGRFDPAAITSITPEVPWPGMWPREECFRDPVPVARDYFLCSHSPRDRFALYVIDRFGNRELLHIDSTYGSMCPTPLGAVHPPPELGNDIDLATAAQEYGQFFLADVYEGIEPTVPRGSVKYIRVVEEVRANLLPLPGGGYQEDHEPFTHWYATPVDRVSGPYGWPSYVAKATWGLAPVELDGSACFEAPAGKTLYFQALDADFNELQRMRSVVQLQPGETRGCIGCHEDRSRTPPAHTASALGRPPSRLEAPPWGSGPFSYERVVQPVWDTKCVSCHDAGDEDGIDLTGRLDSDRVPASYRTLISQGWVHVLDCGYNSGGNEKREPMTFGTLRSKLWNVLDGEHHDVELTLEDRRRIKCWIDMNAPLWPDYVFRAHRPGPKP